MQDLEYKAKLIAKLNQAFGYEVKDLALSRMTSVELHRITYIL